MRLKRTEPASAPHLPVTRSLGPTADAVVPAPAGPSDDAERPELAQTPAEDVTASSATYETEVAAAPAPPVIPEAPAVPRLPRTGHITYDLVYGRDRFPVGRTVQTWEMDDKGYRLASRSETTGIVDLLRSQHRTYSSHGTINRAGLRPQTFTMRRNRGRGTEEARAQFNWEGATLTLGPVAGQRQESLPARSQDLLSFMYQLSLDPPPTGRLRQVVTNGTRIEVYELDVLDEEIIDTPLGRLRALPIRQVRSASEESLALWLGVEYRYVPIKLRFFDRAGAPQGEQIVTEIRLSAD